MKVFQHLFSELVPQLPNIAMYCISQRNLAIQWKHVGIDTCFQAFSHKYQDLLPAYFRNRWIPFDESTKGDLFVRRDSCDTKPPTNNLSTSIPSDHGPLFAANIWVALRGKTLRHLLEPAQARTYLTARIRCYVRTSAVIAWLGELSFRMAWSSTGWWI